MDTLQVTLRTKLEDLRSELEDYLLAGCTSSVPRTVHLTTAVAEKLIPAQLLDLDKTPCRTGGTATTVAQGNSQVGQASNANEADVMPTQLNYSPVQERLL